MTDTMPPPAAPEADDEFNPLGSRDEFHNALAGLSQRAGLCLALRAVKRIAVIDSYQMAEKESRAAGIDANKWRIDLSGGVDALNPSNAPDTATVVHRTVLSAVAIAVEVAGGAFATDAAAEAASYVWKAASLDFARLLQLQHAQLPLTGWDDPRLGPLWPSGAPEWHQQLEREVEEMRAKLDARPDPFAPPIPDAARTQFDDLRKLNEMVASGELAEYSGEFVLLHRGRVVGHGEDLAAARLKASEEHGLPFSAMVHRYIY